MVMKRPEHDQIKSNAACNNICYIPSLIKKINILISEYIKHKNGTKTAYFVKKHEKITQNTSFYKNNRLFIWRLLYFLLFLHQIKEGKCTASEFLPLFIFDIL